MKDTRIPAILFFWVLFLTACYKNEPVPSAEFTFAGNNDFRVPCTVMFTNRSTDSYSWDWQFGDDSVSVARDPVHLYTRPGTYKVFLRAYTESRKEWASIMHEVLIADTLNQ